LFALTAAYSHHRPMESPPEHLVHENVELRRWRETDADLCFRLVSESLEHLRPWMPWATPDYGLADAADYVRRCEAEWAAGTAFQYLIVADSVSAGSSPSGSVPSGSVPAGSVPTGSAGLMARIGPSGLEIGYWVHPARTGRGVATAAAAALTEAALALPGIDHAEIHHDQLNVASGRVPAKLGYAHVERREHRFELAPGDSGKTEIWRITR
jgi:ribosomal-protein-serine acetyltransferase